MGLRGTAVDGTAVVPSVGDTETTPSADVSTILTELVARSQAKVTCAEINVDATLDFQTQAAENLTYLELLAQGAKPTPTGTVYVKAVSAIDELFFQDGNGNEVQITTGGVLNGVGASGDITGTGYGTGGVVVNWNSAGTNYQFKSGSGGDDYAAVTCDGLQLRDGSGNSLTLDVGAMGSNYTATWPAAVPGSEAVMTMNGSGTLSVARTVAAAPAAETAATFDASGNFATADSSTPYAGYKHANVEYCVPPSMMLQGEGESGWTRVNRYWTNAGVSGAKTLIIPILVNVDQTLDEVTCRIFTHANGETLTLTVYRALRSTGAETTLGTPATRTDAGLLTVSSINEGIDQAYSYYAVLSFTAGGASTDVDISQATYTVNVQ